MIVVFVPLVATALVTAAGLLLFGCTEAGRAAGRNPGITPPAATSRQGASCANIQNRFSSTPEVAHTIPWD